MNAAIAEEDRNGDRPGHDLLSETGSTFIAYVF